MLFQGNKVKIQERSEIKHYLILYFSGELEKKIIRYKIKLETKFPDEYYDTRASIQWRPDKVSAVSGHGDPTASRAIKLADIYLNLKRIYSFLKEIKIKLDYLYENEVINKQDIEILKVHFKISNKTFTVVSKENKITNYYINKRINKLKDILYQEVQLIIMEKYN